MTISEGNYNEYYSSNLRQFSKLLYHISFVHSSRLSRVSDEDSSDIDKVVHGFFMQFFPVAYHHVLASEEGEYGAGVTSGKDFSTDYKNCITHSYETLLPFGDIPRDVAKALQKSIGAAGVFLRSLRHGAKVLESVEHLDESHFGGKCSSHLVKINYCQACDGSRMVKSCHGYCLNVMR